MRWSRHFCNLHRVVRPSLATVYHDALPWKGCDALPCAPIEIQLSGLMPLFDIPLSASSRTGPIA
jgi:hypothetical protein